MRQAYEENGAFGDPKTIESQLRENEAVLDRLNKDLSKHLVLMDEVDEVTKTNKQHPQPSDPNHTTENNSSKSPSITNFNHRASIGHESQLSRTNSDISIRPDNSSGNNNRDGTKSSATNRTSNSFADSMSDTASNKEIDVGK